MAAISTGTVQFSHKDETAHIIGKQLTYNDLKMIPAGYGGHIGIIPCYIINNIVHYILCNIQWKKGATNGIVIGEIGGGVKKSEKPYDALCREIREEIPTWFDIITHQMEYGIMKAYAIEYLHVPLHTLRYSITIFVDITPFADLLHTLFSPSKEIQSITITHNLIDMISSANCNCGLTHYKTFLSYKKHFDQELQKYIRVQLYKYMSLTEFMKSQNINA